MWLLFLCKIDDLVGLGGIRFAGWSCLFELLAAVVMQQRCREAWNAVSTNRMERKTEVREKKQQNV